MTSSSSRYEEYKLKNEIALLSDLINNAKSKTGKNWLHIEKTGQNRFTTKNRYKFCRKDDPARQVTETHAGKTPASKTPAGKSPGSSCSVVTAKTSENPRAQSKPALGCKSLVSQDRQSVTKPIVKQTCQTKTVSNSASCTIRNIQPLSGHEKRSSDTSGAAPNTPRQRTTIHVNPNKISQLQSIPEYFGEKCTVKTKRSPQKIHVNPLHISSKGFGFLTNQHSVNTNECSSGSQTVEIGRQWNDEKYVDRVSSKIGSKCDEERLNEYHKYNPSLYQYEYLPTPLTCLHYQQTPITSLEESSCHLKNKASTLSSICAPASLPDPSFSSTIQLSGTDQMRSSTSSPQSHYKHSPQVVVAAKIIKGKYHLRRTSAHQSHKKEQNFLDSRSKAAFPSGLHDSSSPQVVFKNRYKLRKSSNVNLSEAKHNIGSTYPPSTQRQRILSNYTLKYVDLKSRKGVNKQLKNRVRADFKDKEHHSKSYRHVRRKSMLNTTLVVKSKYSLQRKPACQVGLKQLKRVLGPKCGDNVSGYLSSRFILRKLMVSKGSNSTRQNSTCETISGKKTKYVYINGHVYKSSNTKLVKTAAQHQLNLKNISTPKTARKHGNKRTAIIKKLSAAKMKTVTVRGIKFHMDQTGHTLKRISMTSPQKGNSSLTQSRRNVSRVDIAGITYIQTKPGTLVKAGTAHSRRRASHAIQRSIALTKTAKYHKSKEKFCLFYNRFGKCNRREKCPFTHDPSKIAICTRFLRGTCKVTDCKFSHSVSKEKMPVCLYFLRGVCSRDSCPYLHVNVSRNAKVCEDFVNGFCPLGDECKKQHTLVCPSFRKTGKCPQGKKCRLTHEKQQTRQTQPRIKTSVELSSKISLQSEKPKRNVKDDDCDEDPPTTPSFIRLKKSPSVMPEIISSSTHGNNVRIRPVFNSPE